MGVTIYANDRTQGPACAIAAGAATVYRNYFEATISTNDNKFVQVPRYGDRLNTQYNMICDLLLMLDVDVFTSVKNGYVLIDDKDILEYINKQIATAKEQGTYQTLVDALQVGVQTNVGVMDYTNVDPRMITQQVTQVFCSALPVSYNKFDREEWEPFAQLVLDAAYEATILAAAQQSADREQRSPHYAHSNTKLYLTQLGGGAFGNNRKWIVNAIERAINKYYFLPLDVYIVSRTETEPDLHCLERTRFSV